MSAPPPLASTIDTPVTGPIHSKQRFSSLDIIRGVALFGILLMNIVWFAHPMGFEEFLAPNSSRDINFWTWVVENTFFEGTQRTLFSFLFGAGVIVFTSRGEQAGGGIRVADYYYRRNIWLIAFGMIDAYLLLWDGDILYYYGIAALFLFPLRHVKPRNLILVGIAAIFVLVAERAYDHCALLQMQSEYELAQQALSQGVDLDEDQQDAIDAWEEEKEYFAYNEERYLRSIKEHTESYGSVFMRHAPDLVYTQSYIAYRYQVLDSFCMMVIGMALMKLGVLTLQRSNRTYWAMAIIGFALGLPLSAWETSYIVAHNFGPLAWPGSSYTYDISRLLMAMGQLGLLLLFVRSGIMAWLQTRLAAVGRMALTNYLMHSVFAVVIFLSPGFGLYGYYERYQLYFWVFVICLFQLVVSKIWLEHYRFGPVEWLWRSLTYMKMQPMRANPLR